MGYTPHVLVIGGGIVGTATARDLAVRGLDVTLVERETLTTGATGRMQGILYSGARQTDSDLVTDQFARENEILRDIAEHCIDRTGGLLVGDDNRLDDQLNHCEEHGISTEEYTDDAVQDRLPNFAADIDRAIQVPDAVIDPFRLTVATARSARNYGAEIRPHTEVTDIDVADGTIETVTVRHDPPTDYDPTDTDDGGTPLADGGSESDDPFPGQRGQAHVPGTKDPEPSPPDEVADTFENLADESTEELEPDYVVNAAGAWVDDIAGLVDTDIPLSFEAGGMAVTGGRQAGAVVTRCRDDRTDTLVPYGDNTVVGAIPSPADGPEDRPERDDIERVLDALSPVVPRVESAPVLRAYWGVRCWPAPADNRHRFALVDHGRRDDIWGMTTVVGGSFTIHRLIAEKVTDAVCEKFGISRPCQTAKLSLPGSGEELLNRLPRYDDAGPNSRDSVERLGTRANEVLDTDGPDPVVCEAESVTRAEIQDAIGDETSVSGDLNEVRIRTGATMGDCQGGPCGHRLAAELYDGEETEPPMDALNDLLDERWRGQRHAVWGNLSRVMENYVFHADTMNRKTPSLQLMADTADDADSDETVQETDGVYRISDFAGRPEPDREFERPPWGERPV